MIYIFLVCACIGSFMNVLIYRLPLGEDIVWKRSYCPSCHHKLGVLDLVPIFSFLFLNGKCRYCKHKISFSYIIVELLSGCLGVFLYCLYGFHLEMIFHFLVIELLFVISWIDIQNMVIFDGCSFVLFVLALMKIILMKVNLYDHICASFIVPFILWFMNRCVKDSFGGGDIKLMFGMGLYLGIRNTILSFILAVFISSIFALYLIVFKKMSCKSRVPFAPFLSIGMVCSMTFGESIIVWYIHLFSFNFILRSF